MLIPAIKALCGISIGKDDTVATDGVSSQVLGSSSQVQYIYRLLLKFRRNCLLLPESGIVLPGQKTTPVLQLIPKFL